MCYITSSSAKIRIELQQNAVLIIHPITLPTVLLFPFHVAPAGNCMLMSDLLRKDWVSYLFTSTLCSFMQTPNCSSIILASAKTVTNSFNLNRNHEQITSSTSLMMENWVIASIFLFCRLIANSSAVFRCFSFSCSKIETF